MALAGNPDELYMFLGEPPPERPRPPPPRPQPELAQAQAQAPREAPRAPQSDRAQSGSPVHQASAPDPPPVQPSSPSRRAAPPPNPVFPAINPALLPGFSGKGPQEDLYTFLGEEPPPRLARAATASELTPLQRLQKFWRLKQEQMVRERAEREAAAALATAATGGQVRMLAGGLSQHLVPGANPNVRTTDDFLAMEEDGSTLQTAVGPQAGVAAAKQLRLYGAAGAVMYNLAQGRQKVREETLAAPEERDDSSCGYQQMDDDFDEPPPPARSGYELVRSGTSPPVFGKPASPQGGAQGPAAPTSPNGMRRRVQASKQDWYQQMDD